MGTVKAKGWGKPNPFHLKLSKLVSSLGGYYRPKYFAPQQMFAANEPGFYAETYDPNSLLLRKNMLTYSQDYSNAAWVKKDSSVVGQKVIPNAVNTTHGITRSNLSSGGANVFSIRAKPDGYNWMAIQFGNVLTYFNLQAGTIGTIGAGLSALMEPAADGYWDCHVMGIAANNNSQIYVATGNGVVSFAGDTVSGILISETQVEWNTVTPSRSYQVVTDWTTEYLASVTNLVGMWEDSLGGTPVTAVERPVGLWLDKKYNYQRGTVLLATETLNFQDGSWTTVGTAVASSPRAFSVSGTAGEGFSKNLGLVIDQYYELTISYTKGSGGSDFRIANAAASATPIIVQATGASGTLRAIFRAVSGSVYFRLGTVADAITITAFNVRAFAGNHATQAVSASRPILTARYNQFLKSEQFTDATWGKDECTADASGLITTSANVGLFTRRLRYASPITFGTTGARTLFRLKAGTQQFVQTYVVNDGEFWVNIDMATGAYTLNGTRAAFGSVSVSNAGDGFFDYVIEYTSNSATATYGAYLQVIDSLAALRAPNSAAIGVTFTIKHADLRYAADGLLAQPMYQRVNTPTDYDTNLFVHYLKFDGIDDSFVTNNMDLSAVNKVTVWLGVVKLSDAAVTVICEHTVSVSTTDGSFHIAGPNSAATSTYQAITRGSATTATRIFSTYAAPSNDVITAAFDNAAASVADANKVRINGIVPASATSGAIANANFANAPFHIGRRANSSFPLNGRVTSIGVRGTIVPTNDTNLKNMEQWTAQKAGKSFVST